MLCTVHITDHSISEGLEVSVSKILLLWQNGQNVALIECSRLSQNSTNTGFPYDPFTDTTLTSNAQSAIYKNIIVCSEYPRLQKRVHLFTDKGHSRLQLYSYRSYIFYILENYRKAKNKLCSSKVISYLFSLMSILPSAFH